MSNEAPKIDLDGDGVVSKKEEEIYERKAKNRRRMAWLSLVALIASGFSLMFLVPENRLAQLNGILELYWLSLGGIVGAYVGMSAWSARK
jgi:cytochrome bd-type quinol oxidase subunit 2